MNDVDVNVRLQMLEMHVQRLDLALRAVFAVHTEPKRAEALKLLNFLGISEFAQSDREVENIDALQGLDAFIKVLRALHDAGDHVRTALGLQALLFLETKQGQQGALKSWIDTATHEELADDLAELVKKQKLAPKPSVDQPGADARPDTGEEDPKTPSA
ncbi:hypothetical protein [Variovorax paradoxus]|uniref:hypothetical protein n=1 Tax=Variovorax paradoxus TaxID=34073 RepID=UPI001ABC390D